MLKRLLAILVCVGLCAVLGLGTTGCGKGKDKDKDKDKTAKDKDKDKAKDKDKDKASLDLDPRTPALRRDLTPVLSARIQFEQPTLGRRDQIGAV